LELLEFWKRYRASGFRFLKRLMLLTSSGVDMARGNATTALL
jgi:hypothetical protein